jgi:hypothetical protein
MKPHSKRSSGTERSAPRRAYPRLRERQILKTTVLSDKGIPVTVRLRDGRPFFDASAIFAIWMEREPRKPEIIGTGFYVTRFGHFLTARHVLMDAYEHGKAAYMLHMLDDDKSAIVRHVTEFSCHEGADVALCALEHPPNYVFNAVPRLTVECPTIGESIVAVGYNKNTKLNGRAWEIAPKYLSGSFEEAHPLGRDRVMIPFPCFRISMNIPGGASGGPVFDKQGRVFGVSCSNYEGTDLSYLARIEDVLQLTAAGMKFGPSEPPTDRRLYQLGKSGHVVFSPPI